MSTPIAKKNNSLNVLFIFLFKVPVLNNNFDPD
jgi:hypothetical protein